MDFYSIWAKEQNPYRHMNFVSLNYQYPATWEVPSFYAKTSCPRCKWVTSKSILKHGVAPGLTFKVRSGTEFFETNDHFFMCSTRAKNAISKIDSTVKFRQAPGTEFHVVLPHHTIEFDRQKADISPTVECRKCGRKCFRGALTHESLHLRRGTKSRIFTTDPSINVMAYRLCCSQTVMESLKKARINGMWFHRMPMMDERDKFV